MVLIQDKMYDKYLPLVDRITTRNELNDVISRLIGGVGIAAAEVEFKIRQKYTGC